MTDQRRIELLTDALRRLLRHEPWPPSVQSEKDYGNAWIVLANTAVSGPQDGEQMVLDSKVPREAGSNE